MYYTGCSRIARGDSLSKLYTNDLYKTCYEERVSFRGCSPAIVQKQHSLRETDTLIKLVLQVKSKRRAINSEFVHCEVDSKMPFMRWIRADSPKHIQ